MWLLWRLGSTHSTTCCRCAQGWLFGGRGRRQRGRGRGSVLALAGMGLASYQVVPCRALLRRRAAQDLVVEFGGQVVEVPCIDIKL
jgi:hypothetical protein